MKSVCQPQGSGNSFEKPVIIPPKASNKMCLSSESFDALTQMGVKQCCPAQPLVGFPHFDIGPLPSVGFASWDSEVMKCQKQPVRRQAYFFWWSLEVLQPKIIPWVLSQPVLVGVAINSDVSLSDDLQDCSDWIKVTWVTEGCRKFETADIKFYALLAYVHPSSLNNMLLPELSIAGTLKPLSCQGTKVSWQSGQVVRSLQVPINAFIKVHHLSTMKGIWLHYLKEEFAQSHRVLIPVIFLAADFSGAPPDSDLNVKNSVKVYTLDL